MNYAHYNNTAGAINGTRYIDCGIVVLTADPFTNAGARDFSLNATAGGGAELRNIAHAAIDGNWTSYADLGAVATRGGPVHRIGGVLVR